MRKRNVFYSFSMKMKPNVQSTVRFELAAFLMTFDVFFNFLIFDVNGLFWSVVSECYTVFV